jgi:Fe-S-cluster containining protein
MNVNLRNGARGRERDKAVNVLKLGVLERPRSQRKDGGGPAFAGRDDPFREELRALYAETDALLAPFSCDASGECCHFSNTGREPYPTAVELAEVVLAARSAPPARLARNAKKKSLPLADARVCPLLSEDGRCTIYASRPFGCRTFFCERIQGPSKLPRAALGDLSRRIAALAARFAPKDPHPRPLTRALASKDGRRRAKS